MYAVGLVFTRLGNEQIVQVCPVELDIRSAMLTLVLGRERKGLDDLAGIVQTKNVCPRLHSNPRNRISETEIAKNVHGIGADLNAGTNLAQDRSLFVNLYVEALAHKAACGRQSADACSCDQYFRTCHEASYFLAAVSGSGVSISCGVAGGRVIHITATANIAHNAGTAPETNSLDLSQCCASMMPPTTGPMIEPIRPMPSAQPTPVARTLVG